MQTVGNGSVLPRDVDLGPGATIDVSGIWTNDSPTVTLQPGTAPTIVNGGSVSAVQFSQLTAANVLESDDLPNSLVRTDAALPAATASVTLPAHSIALLTVQLAPKSP